MDYDENGYEGEDLKLAGEGSSKASSVLRPYALPKFDFDDSLQSHLRFDSLVENEVFLGISSQEDNQWIEDFSRGNSGIGFSSSAAESCPLPRCNNVWSEATSSESVEMLLKAVGQEEMDPGKHISEESDPDHKSGSISDETELKLKQNHKMDDVNDHQNPLPSPVEPPEDYSQLNQCSVIEGLKIDESSHLVDQGEKLLADSCFVVDKEKSSCSDVVGGNLQVDIKSSSDNAGEPQRPPDESLSRKLQETLSVRGVQIGTECASQKFIASAKEIDDQNKFSDISVVVSSGFANDNIKAFEERQEFSNAKEDILNGSASETVRSTVDSPLAVTSNMESKEESAVERSIINRERSSVLLAREPILLTAEKSTETKQNSPSNNLLHEESSLPLLTEVLEGHIAQECLDAVETFKNSDREKSTSGQPSVCTHSNSLVEVSASACFGSSRLSTMQVISSHTDGERSIAHAVEPGDTEEASVVGKLVTKDVENVSGASGIHRNDLGSVDQGDVPLRTLSTQPCGDNASSNEADVCKLDLDHSASGKGDEKLPLDLGNVVSDDKRNGLVSSDLGEGVEKGEIIPGLDYGTSSGSLPGNVEKNKAAKPEVSESSTMSVMKEPMEAESTLTPAFQAETGEPGAADAEAGTKIVEQYVSSVGAPIDATIHETSEKLAEHIELSHVHDLILQENGAKSATVESSRESKAESCQQTPVVAGVDQPNQISSPGSSCIEKQQSERSKQENQQAFPHPGSNTQPVLVKPGRERNDVPEEKDSFTFDVRPLTDQFNAETGKDAESFPSIHSQEVCLAGVEATPTSCDNLIDAKKAQKVSNGSTLASNSGTASTDTKGACERKPRKGSGRSSKESAKKGLKEVRASRQDERVTRTVASLSPSGTGQSMSFETGSVGRSVAKPNVVVSVPTSILPDLNASALFNQPFTDLQQVQLRAQIFVYGSLIQGAVPDEACMVSAFDGGRSVWESSWRTCVERLHGQKSQGNNLETPVQSRSGKSSDQASKKSLPQSKVNSSPAVRDSKGTLSPVVNPMIPLSSPLWNASTPSCDGLPSSSIARSAVFDYQAASPLHPYQTPPVRNFAAQTTSWPSQTPFAGPWVASSQSSPLSTVSHYSSFPITEPVKLIPVKELSVPTSSSMKHATPFPVALSGNSGVLAGMSSMVDLKKAATSSGKDSANPKTRKRKKSSGAEVLLQSPSPHAQTVPVPAPLADSHLLKKAPPLEDLSQISLLARSQAGSVSTLAVSSHYSTSVAIITPSSFLQSNPVASSIVSSEKHRIMDSSLVKDAVNLDDFSKVEEAKVGAEEAAAHAATAVSHCQAVWSQVDKQKNAGLSTDVEAKLSCAAVAIAAAASVARAAASASKIALKAAMQAKQMADEAVSNCGKANATESNVLSHPRLANNSDSATPASILTGGIRDHGSSSIMSAAREAARLKVKAASDAARHAENLDAIVKAAELAAEAVSQAGKVVAMSDPLPLIELAQAGPDGYWKVSQGPDGQPSEPNDTHKSRAAGSAKTMIDQSMSASFKLGENNSEAHKDGEAFGAAKSGGVIAGSDIESRSKSRDHDGHATTSIIREGCLVEVFRHHGEVKGAWFSANVLSLKDGQARVRYNKLQSPEGSQQLEEWVPLEPVDKAPVIRIPHPMTAVEFEPARKRRRAAVKDYNWSVGDKVDAWVKDCWREGVVAEKNDKDETTFSVRFPAQAETLTVRSWYLRPTLIWSHSQWVECSRSRLNISSQGDTPQGKRLKMGSSTIEAKGKGKGKMTETTDFADSGKKDESRLLPLSASEKVFNIGNTKDGNKTDTLRTVRSGLQKEGSRVIYGIPKPGKKRKFMEVSKHYVSDRSIKIDVPDDSVKLAKYLMPQGAGSRGWKGGSKVDLKEKQQTVEFKSRALRSGKPPTVPSKTMHKDEFAPLSADHVLKGSDSNDEDESGVLPETRKKMSSMNKSERLNKGKFAHAIGKAKLAEADDKMIPGSSEPRRSNRRIQPTSRLLEGLQSSLIISKIPSSSHDKSQRSQNKGTSRGSQ